MTQKMKCLHAFSGKRVFITGDTGFKGAWLSIWLNTLGAEVLGFALPPEHDNGLFNLAGLAKRTRHVDGDVRDGSALNRVISDFKPDVVLHLAAQALVRKSYLSPKETFDINVGGTVNMLEAVRLSDSIKAAVFITSDKCYFNKEWIWGYRENDQLGGHDPYSASKAAAEMAISSYNDSFLLNRVSGPGLASTRAGNVIGGGDRAQNRIVPDCITALENDQTITVRNPGATRPWQHVLEPLSGYLMLAAKLLQDPKKYSGAWNFGPSTDSVQNVEELVSQIIVHWDNGKMQIALEPGQPHEANLLQLNTDKAQIKLGWRSNWTVAETIKKTVAWYRQVYDGSDPYVTTLAQIRRYMEMSSD